MANTPEKVPSTSPATRLVDRDVVQVQFAIDDLIKSLSTFQRSASCNGCNHCKAEVDLATPAQ